MYEGRALAGELPEEVPLVMRAGEGAFSRIAQRAASTEPSGLEHSLRPLRSRP
jgi:hypothetical protein